MADGAANPTTAPIDARLSGWNGATWDRLRATAGQVQARLYDANGSGLTSLLPNFDSANLGGSSAAAVAAAQYAYNGSTWDRLRNNTDLMLLAQAARTAQTDSPVTASYGARGVAVHLALNSAPGSIPNTADTLSIRIYDDGAGGGAGPQSSAYSFQTPAGSALQSDLGYTLTLVVYPGATATPDSSLIKLVPGSLVSRYFTVIIFPSGASSWTYGVTATLLS